MCFKGFQVLQEELQLTNVEPTANLKIKGHPSVLETLEIIPSNDQHLVLFGNGYYDEEDVKVCWMQNLPPYEDM